jgi:hypothetical protein
MNRHRTSLFTLITLITLVITPAAAAEIYRCDGPDGPIYSDKKCGSDAANVEVRESSGLSGVTEQDKINLAEKKLERQQEREQAQSRNQQDRTVNSQSNAYPTENPGVWLRGQNRPRDRVNPKNLPAKPRPVTLPAKPRPAIPPKKR